uniref:Pentapeptide repeat-containing protein n=1 Tax=Candidatus Kentrum sp. FW TaxID=2126338 RepID=A0A450TPK1_9GAMM|nr:MAG: Pentapeptide repeat-containing protein [Candidatus Kentron sp. FW]
MGLAPFPPKLELETRPRFRVAIGILLGFFFFIMAAGLLLLTELTIKDWPWTSLSALTAAPSLVITWYWRTIHKQKELDTAEQGLLTERFTRAIELLGNKNLQVCLGGIYALERIAKDSEQDHWTVMETLCAFVRENTKEAKVADPGNNKSSSASVERGGSAFEQPDIAVQAALTVIGRRGKERRDREREKDKRLDLKSTHLERADLRRVHLEKADLRRAHLKETNLADAHLDEAHLWRTHLEEARLGGAHLKEARFWGAHLEKANLVGAYLQKADFRDAYLDGTYLDEAHLEGAKLLFAKGLIQSQIDAAICDKRTELPAGISWSGPNGHVVGPDTPDDKRTTAVS